MNVLRGYCVLPRYTLFPREIFRRDEEDQRRRCRGHRRGGLTTYPAEKIRGTAGVVRELCGLGTAALLLLGVAPSPRAIWRDAFDDPRAWRPVPAQGVGLTLSPAEGKRGKALRLDFDFHGRAGWAAIRRDVAIDLPENWELDLSLSGDAPANDLEIKLVDASGENVWWAVRRDFAPPQSWTTLRSKKRQFSFAWGPERGGE